MLQLDVPQLRKLCCLLTFCVLVCKFKEEQTPLHVASRLGNVDIVMLLLQHGADVDATTKDLYTPLHIAAKESQEEVIQSYHWITFFCQ